MVRRSASIVAGLAVSLAAGCGGGGSGSDSPAATVERYAVGGSVTGLTGAGLVLQNNGADDLVVNFEGRFHFPTPVDDGAPYAVTVKAQPPGVGWDGELHVDAAGAATEPVVRLDGAGNGLALWIEQSGTGAWQLMSARHR